MNDRPDLVTGLGGLVERFDHVSLAVWNIEETLTLVGLMGGTFRSGGDVPARFRWAQWDLPGHAKLEIVQPLDPDDPAHFLVRFLRTRGPGLHHLTFKVTNLAEAVNRARALGFEVVGVSTDRWWKEAFVHPMSAQGVLVQLAEWTEQANPPPVTLEAVLAGRVRE